MPPGTSRNSALRPAPKSPPHLVRAGFSYQLRRFTFNTAFRWSDDTPTNTTGTRYRRHNGDLDADMTYVFSNRYSVFLNVKNLFDTLLIDMERAPNTPDVSTLYIRGRTYFSLGFKAAF